MQSGLRQARLVDGRLHRGLFLSARRCGVQYSLRMRRAMDQLSGFVRRRRRLVLGVWIVLLLASIPFASRQTENLTGGGFEVPNTGSVAVDNEIDRFQGVSSNPLAVVLQDRGGGDLDAARGR